MWLIDPRKMTRNTFLMIIGLIMITSCYTKHGPEAVAMPDNLIERDTLVFILADIEIIESALRQDQNFGKETDDKRDSYYRSIFANYNISKGQFDSSMMYYRQDMAVIDGIYEDVITRLSVITSEVELND